MTSPETAVRPCLRQPSASRFALLALLATGVLLSLGLGTASASKQVVNYIGNGSTGTKGGEFTFPRDVAVNNSGAGPADKGDIYVTDGNDFGPVSSQPNRIQRLGRDDSGTPADPTDDSYFFISAWGAGVDSSSSGSDYEICTVASSCQAALGSGGNGNSGGNGSLFGPSGVIVDQDTGDVYVVDRGNKRINVYDGAGLFLRSFGFDVVSSGPGNTGVGYEVCVAANGDVCKAGVAGSGAGQITKETPDIAVSQPDGNTATGTVFLAGAGNHRVDTFNLDGSSPASFGSATFSGFGEVSGQPGRPDSVAVDSRGIVYAGNQANQNQIERYDSENANGGGVGFLAPIAAPPLLPSGNFGAVTVGLGVDPDSDGPGPDSDVLYVSRVGEFLQQFGPVNAPGLAAPPVAVDDTHATTYRPNPTEGLGIDESTGDLYVVGRDFAQSGGEGVYVLGTPNPPPTATLDAVTPVDAITSTSATVHAEVNPNGTPALSYHLEYSLDGASWKSMPSVLLGSQKAAQSISPVLDLPGTGLEPATLYHVRLVAARPFTDPIVTPEVTFTTLSEKPSVETAGSPVRGATTARLEGRVNPRNSTTTYRFEYGDQGPCDSNPCTATEPQLAGSGGVTEFVSEAVAGLQPQTTYHYRVVAESGAPGSPSFGEDTTLTTRSSDAPLEHGPLPGPTGSDRAYEQVNLPDTGGNPVNDAPGFADDGNSAIYRVAGGTPISDTGSFSGMYFAERTATGWQTRRITPPRAEIRGPDWQVVTGKSDLSSIVSVNNAAATAPTVASAWRLHPDAPPDKLFEAESPQEYQNQFGVSADGTRVVELLRGGQLDPAYPEAAAQLNLYDISGGGPPQLVSLMPGNDVAPCGVGDSNEAIAAQATRWVSADGSRVYFPSPESCGAAPRLFMREMESEQTRLISGSPLSGPTCDANFLRGTAEAAFFWTQSRLAAVDTVPTLCKGVDDGDVYRYDLGDGTLKCVTCVIPGLPVNVLGASSAEIAVAEDGSRVYFKSKTRLLASAPQDGYGAYRIDVASGDLAFVGPVDVNASIGIRAGSGNTLSHDGAVLIFRSRDEGLNPLGDGSTDNNGTSQYYRYDDEGRSLICVSCPADGSPPRAEVPIFIVGGGGSGTLNVTPLSADGNTLAFPTPTALVGADQNTTGADQNPEFGQDVYEWRDGKLLLVSDGLTSWRGGQGSQPVVRGMSPSGRDIFFGAPTQYTADALDGYTRLYDARIGGGIVFPVPPPPCPLEVCQGTPKGAPEEQAPGTGAFSGPGNVSKPARTVCAKPKRRVRKSGKTRCLKPTRNKQAQHKAKANPDRRATR